MNKPLLVIGSSNTDMVVRSRTLPRAGETVLGGTFLMNPGGKGANQAVAAARLGGNVTFVAKVGEDLFGQEAIEGFQRAGIDTQYVLRDPNTASGVALIMVDEQGENCISVALGANGTLRPEELARAAPAFEAASHVLIQLEIPLETVSRAVDLAQAASSRVILNPAPAQRLPAATLEKVSLITPNESEAALLTGIEVVDEASARKAADHLHQQGVPQVIITLGAAGAYVSAEEMSGMVPAPRVTAVDSTAAGDTFNGALAVALAEDMPLRQAVEFANRAAAISVTRPGAQASTPLRTELG